MRTLLITFAAIALSSCARVRPNVTFETDDQGERCHREADRGFRACLNDKEDREVCEDAQDAQLMKCGGEVADEAPGLKVSTSEELGHLSVLRSYAVKYTRSFVLEYTNDTADVLRKVRLECSVSDVRGSVVTTSSVEIPEAQPGATSLRTVHLLDSMGRAASADCRIAVAQRG